MSSGADLQPRQLWANPTPTSTSLPRHCTPFRLPSGGLLAIGDGNTITLSQEAVFQPYCTSKPELSANLSNLESVGSDDKDPFYASTLPQMYAIAAVTVVSYLLVVILFITPRTFFVGGSGGGSGFLGQRGMISGASGSASVIGVGGRPWLQKVAALTVAISLTIASVDTFQVAQRQYDRDYSDAAALTNEVVSSLELRIVRVVSETCLWLAQAQTLIRLFPRHKEKVIIKWAGFVLIALDTIFSILNNFVSGSSRSAPRKFQDAVPALSYLFTFCLSLIYAAWIIYYSLSKRRYAFMHPKMRNICLVALFSYIAVLIPVVFFILDISIYDVAGWGNYVRWVGAAAASVVVWEWVERIEALERDERKDGILGREIFDGDEMLEITPSSAATWSGSRRAGGSGGNNPSSPNTDVGGVSSIIQRLNRGRPRAMRKPSRASRAGSSHLTNVFCTSDAGPDTSVQTSQPTPPPTAATPLSATNHTRPQSSVSQRDLHQVDQPSSPQQHSSVSGSSGKPNDPGPPESRSREHPAKPSMAKTLWDTLQKIPIPFLSRHMSPPIEVKQAVRSSQQPTTTEPSQPSTETNVTNTHGLLDRLGLKKTAPAPKAPLPVTIVPAPPRNPTSWNDVRFHAASPPFARPFSQQSLHQPTRSDTPLYQRPRRSTPTARSIDRSISFDPHQPRRPSPVLEGATSQNGQPHGILYIPQVPPDDGSASESAAPDGIGRRTDHPASPSAPPQTADDAGSGALEMMTGKIGLPSVEHPASSKGASPG
ncbi:MAG: hypothetical protein LQ338_003756 [Usnochroma carphineum]|nr:MAG: hypothetical protein LQ338_003756 [Usnochroma carphineum]